MRFVFGQWYKRRRCTLSFRVSADIIDCASRATIGTCLSPSEKLKLCLLVDVFWRPPGQLHSPQGSEGSIV